LTNTSFMGDLDESMTFAESEIFKLSSFAQKKDFRHIRFSMDELLIKIDKIVTKQLDVIGVPSGYTEFDRYTSGWQRGDLIIMAGRPSMGKTALALEFAKATAKLGHAVGFFSLEMGEEQLTARTLSSVSGLSNTDLKAGKVGDFNKLCKQADEIAQLPIYLDDTSALTLFELRSKAKKMIVKHKVELLVVDYLQLMKAEAGSREQEVSQISRGLKAIGKELGVPVIALSQLNRQVEDRADKRPRLADLRESGAIEQDADMVLFILRPAYYGIKEITLSGGQVNTEGLIMVDIAKHRNGALGMIPLKHNVSMSRIISFDDEFPEETLPF
jgi:replicative DNA helicase